MLTEKKAAQANRKEISYFVDLKHLKLIIDEVEIDYLEHKANKDFLFITINNKVEKISKNEELRQFGCAFFEQAFMNECLKGLEKLSMQNCYLIISRLPPKESYFATLFKKVSQARLCKLVLDKLVYRSLINAFSIIMLNKAIPEEDIFLNQSEFIVENNLKTVHGRLIYLLDYFQVDKLLLKEALENAINTQVVALISHRDFIRMLYQAEEHWLDQHNKRVKTTKKLNLTVIPSELSFIGNLIKVIRTLQFIKSNRSQGEDQSHRVLLRKYVLNQKCLSILRKKLEDYALSLEQQILLVIVFGFAFFPSQFWQEVFADHPSNAPQNNIVTKGTCANTNYDIIFDIPNRIQGETNRSQLVQLLQKSLMNQGNQNWQLGLFVIHGLLDSRNPQALQLVIMVFGIIVEHLQQTEELQLTCIFLQSFFDESHKFKQYLLSVFGYQQFICKLITQLDKIICRESRRVSGNKWYSSRLKINSKLLVEVFHVYGMLVYFEKNFKIEIKKENIDILSTLLKITSKQNGVIYGVRKSFIIMLEMLKDNMKRLQDKNRKSIQNEERTQTQRMRSDSTDNNQDKSSSFSIDISLSFSDDDFETNKYAPLLKQ